MGMSTPDENQERPRYSPSTKKICNTLRIIADCARKGIHPVDLRLPEEEKIKKIDLQEYILAVRELTGTDTPFTEKILTERLAYLRRDSKIKVHYPEKHKCTIAAIACSDKGFPLPAEQIQSGEYVRSIITDEANQTQNGYIYEINELYEYLPDEVKDLCTFEILQYDNSDDNQSQDIEKRTQTKIANCEQVAKAYESTYKKAQLLFNKQTTNPKDLN
jgi:hypothetical protein